MEGSLRFPLRVDDEAFDDGPTSVVSCPWDGTPVGEVVLADARRAGLAAEASRRAFERTRRLSAFDRARLLRSVATAVEREADALATLLALEAAKPIALARNEVARAVSTLEIGAGEATRIGGEVVPLDTAPATAGFAGACVRVPAGPVLAISPYNFPLNLVCHKLAPALAAGCPVLLKPPPQAPLTSLRLCDIVREAGAPSGTFQVVPCEVDVAETLVRDDRFAVLSFTGSAAVGWRLKSIAGRKRVLLELGGNAAAVVGEDADVGWASARLLVAGFAYAGQVCIKAQRIYLHERAHDAFLGDFLGRLAPIAPRPPLDPAGLLSSLIDERASARVGSWVADAAAAPGVRVLHGGGRDGSRHDPTVIAVDGAGAGLRVVDEEVFGPVVTVHRCASFGEAIARAGSTRYGLQAAVFTHDVRSVRAAFDALEVGAIVVNDAPTFRVDSMPYGGVRESGAGREGVKYAIEAMTERKLLVVGPA